MAKSNIEFCMCCGLNPASKKGKCPDCYKNGGQAHATFKGRPCADCSHDTQDKEAKYCPECRDRKAAVSIPNERFICPNPKRLPEYLRYVQGSTNVCVRKHKKVA